MLIRETGATMSDPITLSLIFFVPAGCAAGYTLWTMNRKLNQLSAVRPATATKSEARPQVEMPDQVPSIFLQPATSEPRCPAFEVRNVEVREEAPVNAAPSQRLTQLAPGETLCLASAENSENLIEIARATESPSGGKRPSVLTPTATEKLSRLVQSVVGEGGKTAMAQAGTYILKFSPEILRGLKDGTLEMVRNQNGLRAIVRSTSGAKQYVANATLESPLGSPTSVALLAWQVAAIVTAQKYLADIDQKLGILQGAMTEVLDWLADQERGMLIGNYQYLTRIRSALTSQDYNENDLREFSSQLEHIDRECLQVQCSAHERLKRYKSDILVHAKKKISAEQAISEITSLDDNCNRAVQVILMTLQIRCLTLELKAATSVAGNGLQARLDELKTEYSNLQQTFRECLEPLTAVPDLDHWFGLADKKKLYETEVKNLKLKAEKEFADVMHSKDLQLSHIERTLHTSKKSSTQSLNLRVQVGENGRLLAIEPEEAD